MLGEVPQYSQSANVRHGSNSPCLAGVEQEAYMALPCRVEEEGRGLCGTRTSAPVHGGLVGAVREATAPRLCCAVP
jgi:hypothetical protein